jgi:hypothetical protein
MKKRNRNVVYAVSYGAGKKTARRIFLQNKQNRRMPARQQKKVLNELIDSCAAPIIIRHVHDEVIIELQAKR